MSTTSQPVTCWRLSHGRSGERYILGGEDLSLREILTQIAHLSGQQAARASACRTCVVLPLAFIAEGFGKISGRALRLSVEGVRMARKRMFFSSAKARAELGYRSRPAVDALSDAVRWFDQHGRLR